MLFVLISTAVFIFLLWMFYSRFFGAEYYPAESKIIEKAIALSGLKKNETFYDLGSGDGKVVNKAAEFCKKAIGIEIDPIRVLISKLKSKCNAEFIRGNFYSENLGNADVVFIYLRQWTNDKLEEKFKRELKKGTRIISYWWTLKGFKPYKTDAKLRLYAYKI